jgi:hypothetical protein
VEFISNKAVNFWPSTIFVPCGISTGAFSRPKPVVCLHLSYAHRKQRGWKSHQWEESLQAYGSGEVLLDLVASNSANTDSNIAVDRIFDPRFGLSPSPGLRPTHKAVRLLLSCSSQNGHLKYFGYIPFSLLKTHFHV